MLAACREAQRPLGPGTPSSLNATPTAIECASTSWLSATGYIGPEGGQLSVPGASVRFPEGALQSTQSVSFSAGPLGTDSTGVMVLARNWESATFAVPATVTLNFQACGAVEEDMPAEGALFNETVEEFSDSTVVTPEAEPPTAQEVVLSVQSFSWFIIAH